MLKQRGISLVEMLITLSLGLLLMASISAVFTNTLGLNSRSLQASQLQEEAVATMQLILSDLRRANYTANYEEIVVDPSGNSNPFADSLIVASHPDEAPNSCVLFGYDADSDGVDDGVTERFGYRLRDQQVQRRQNGNVCADNGWQGLTSADAVVVEQLTFTLTEQVTGVITEQWLNIVLRVRLQQDATMVRELNQQVVLRNAAI